MAGYPTADALIAAVREFLAGLSPTASLRDAFHVKVAGNVLAIVERELAAPPLPPVFGLSDAELCARIRAGTLDIATTGLLDALIAATCARLAVDNPRYPTLTRLTGDAAPRR